jgi:O-antigen/teichoic acid export membrane protein
MDMAGIRRMLAWAAISRYLVMLMNLVTTAIIARLLQPEEFGLSVLGMAIYGMAEAVRELGGGAYLIQHKALTSEQIQTTFTVSFLITIVLTTVILLAADSLADLVGAPQLSGYFRLVAVCYAMGPFVYPNLALMSRELAMEKIAVFNVSASAINSIATVLLAVKGFSYLSFGWGAVVSSIASILIGYYLRPDPSMYRLRLSEWREVTTFSTYDSATSVILRIWEFVPYFIISRFLDTAAIGLCQRAIALCQVPEKVIVAAVGAIALPVFSEQVRQGKPLKANYLAAIEYITGIQWPALVLLGLLADPVVSVLYGSQWTATVPLVRIMCLSLLFYFPIGLNYPLLIAVGAIRSLPALVSLQAFLSLSVMALAAPYGIHAAVSSMLITVPISVLLSMIPVRKYLSLQVVEILAALRKSAVITLAMASAPVIMLIAMGRGFTPTVVQAGFIATIAAAGWLLAIWATEHPLWSEILRYRLKTMSLLKKA